MPNQYNKPISSGFRNTYTSQFVPLPLEIFARANERDQKIQDTQVAQANDTSDGLWKVQTIADSDKEYTDKLKASYDEAATMLVNKDLTQRENQDAVKKLIKNTVRDPDLNTIMSNTAKYQEWQKNKDEHIKNNTYEEFNDAGKATYEDYVKSGGYKSGKSISSDIFKYENVRPIQEQYSDDMSANGADYLKKVGETFYTDGFKGISKNQAYTRALESFNQYAGTTAAQQEGRRYDMMVRQAKPSQLTKGGELKSQSKQDFLFKGLLDAGLEKVYGVSNTGIAAALNADKKKKEEAANLGTFLTQGANPVLTGGYKFDYDDKGDIKGSGQAWKDTWNKSDGILDFIKKVSSDDSFNMSDNKDKTAYMLQAAAKLNGMKPKDYVEMKAGPDVKLTTTFKTLPVKTLDAYNKQFYDMTRNTGVLSTIPMMNIKTGEKGSATEILRLMSERGELVNKKGEKISMSNNPTPGEVKQVIDEISTGIIGEQAPNYFSPKSMVAGFGTQQIAIDRTYGGQLTDQLIKSGELSLQAVKDAKKEAIKAAPIIEGGYIHYYDEKSKQVMKEKLSNLKD